jgi:hypothetical protein
LKAQQGRQERKETSAQLELLDHKAFKESKAKQVPQDQSVQQDLAVQLEQQDRLAKLAQQDWLAQQVQLDLRAMSAQLVPQDLAVLLEL